MKGAQAQATYVIRATTGEVKVGRSTQPERRLRELRCYHGPDIQLVHKSNLTIHAERIEKLAHKLLTLSHVHHEWFTATVEEAVEAIERAITIAGGHEPEPIEPEPPKSTRPSLFMMRADARLWSDLDTLQLNEAPIRSRSDIARDLIAREAERVRKRRAISERPSP